MVRISVLNAVVFATFALSAPAPQATGSGDLQIGGLTVTEQQVKDLQNAGKPAAATRLQELATASKDTPEQNAAFQEQAQGLVGLLQSSNNGNKGPFGGALNGTKPGNIPGIARREQADKRDNGPFGDLNSGQAPFDGALNGTELGDLPKINPKDDKKDSNDQGSFGGGNDNQGPSDGGFDGTQPENLPGISRRDVTDGKISKGPFGGGGGGNGDRKPFDGAFNGTKPANFPGLARRQDKTGLQGLLEGAAGGQGPFGGAKGGKSPLDGAGAGLNGTKLPDILSGLARRQQ
ncbi:hypothetical protein CDD80_6137 [Ophiocordyceps camponoti-rufipedis]|uniref:Uncharacterized protein n=1 Tax=Ophiocordyceps camponoti-rufipedis TaxID=2004952 RepID=A0A2C5ZCW4_9HYPO|nr:hypothetical protein CDD80_6137 [Ophiocordyceps camponoti-rufipedis]